MIHTPVTILHRHQACMNRIVNKNKIRTHTHTHERLDGSTTGVAMELFVQTTM